MASPEIMTSVTKMSNNIEETPIVGTLTQTNSDQIITIEEVREQMNSCSNCGVSWAQNHISLGCSECGGFPMERPCPDCNGNCGAVWKRDLMLSHTNKKAYWVGKCNKTNKTRKATSTEEDELNL